jgi:hypothetical protein
MPIKKLLDWLNRLYKLHVLDHPERQSKQVPRHEKYTL